MEIFTPLEETVEYNEKPYYFDYNNTVLNKFWFDAAEYVYKNGDFKNFFSKNFIHITEEPTEAIAVMAFTDLSFIKKELNEYKNHDLFLIPSTPLILLNKEII